MIQIILPRSGPGLLMQEECCWSRQSRAVPAMPLHLAAWLSRERGPAVEFVTDASVDWTQPAAMIFSWIFGEELEPMARKCSLLVANPSSSAAALRTEFPGIHIIEARDLLNTDESLICNDLYQLGITFNNAVVQFSSGCPWRCNFCVWAHKYRLRRPEAVAEELCEFSARGIKKIGLLGNEISGKPDWLKRLLHWSPTDLDITTDLNIRNATGADVDMAADLGVKHASLGIEFLTDSLLTSLHKGHDVDDALKLMRLCAAAGIGYRFSLRQGVGETYGDLAELLTNLAELHGAGLNPERITLGGMDQWPGSSFDPGPDPVNAGTAKYPRWTARLSEEVKTGWRAVADYCIARGWAPKPSLPPSVP